jgi:hypothetical protein
MMRSGIGKYAGYRWLGRRLSRLLLFQPTPLYLQAPFLRERLFPIQPLLLQPSRLVGDGIIVILAARIQRRWFGKPQNLSIHGLVFRRLITEMNASVLIHPSIYCLGRQAARQAKKHGQDETLNLPLTHRYTGSEWPAHV